MLTITKAHNSVVNRQKLMRYNPNLVLVKMYAYAKFIKFHQFLHKILSENEILTIIKGQILLLICENWHATTKIWLKSMHMQNLIKFN